MVKNEFTCEYCVMLKTNNRFLEVNGVSKRQSKLHSSGVETLNNDYVRSNEEKAKQKRKRAIFRRRRIALYLAVAGIILFLLTDLLFYQKDRLAIKEAEKQALEEQLADVQEQQEMLKLQIAKLEDDEYIAKLARKEYFLSDEGEIIFTIPKEDKEEEDVEGKQ